MKKHLHAWLVSACVLVLNIPSLNAQFIMDSSQTFFVCNATGSQTSVSAFGDANGGTYSFWIDKRNGSNGTAIYGQHLDSLGVPQWAANGKLFYQGNAKEVWLMKAVPWQNGFLMGWVEGPFGAGGDSLLCNYFNSNGVSQWGQPVVVANKQMPAIIYVNFDDMDIYPNDSGATVTYGLTQNGGNSLFSYNRIGFTGNLRWPADNNLYQGGGYYYHTGYDNHNGFYVASSTGGLGAPIFMGHFDLAGNMTIPAPVDITGTAGGRNNSQWKVLCGSDTSAYIVWSSYTNQDISIRKIKADGNLPWNDAKQICSASGSQEYPDAIIKNNIIYSTWSDGRPGAANYYIYMQKTDSSGAMIWASDGIQISGLNSYIPYPKPVAAGTNLIAAYVVAGGFHAQQLHDNGNASWYQDGIVVNVNNPPFYGDYQLVSDANGNVTAVWRETGDNICAARIRPNGTLTSIKDPDAINFSIFPNPASGNFTIESSDQLKNSQIEIYNMLGKIVYTASYNGLTKQINLNVKNGIYLVRIYNDEGEKVVRLVLNHT